MERYPRFQGGYIWDWQDKALLGITADGNEYFAYGGDFGESIIDWECPPFMTNNGVVQANLRWKPVAYEVKEAYCPVWIERFGNSLDCATALQEGTFLLKNRTMTQWGRDFRCEAVLRENGVEISRWEVKLPDLPPMSEQTMQVEIPECRKLGREYHLEFSISRKTDTWYSKAGEEMGKRQFELAGGVLPTQILSSGKTVFLTETETEFKVSGESFTAVFPKETGGIITLIKDGIHYLAGGLTPCLTRPITGLDVQPGWGWYDIVSQLEGMVPKAARPVIFTAEGQIRLEFPWKMQSKANVLAEGKTCYTVADGKVGIEYTIRLPESWPFVPRAGVELILSPGLEHIRSYSRGPLENYCDRKLCAPIQVWESTVSEQHFPFSPPSETGGHEDTRWLEIHDPNGGRLRIEAEKPFHFDVRHHAIRDYTVGHEHDMPVRAESYLHIDAAHGPIGSDMAWSTAMPGEYCLTGGTYSLRFILETCK